MRTNRNPRDAESRISDVFSAFMRTCKVVRNVLPCQASRKRQGRVLQRREHDPHATTAQRTLSDKPQGVFVTLKGVANTPFSFGSKGGYMERERVTILQGIRLTPTDYAVLRSMAGPRGGSAFVRALIRAEAARRELMKPKKGRSQ